MTASNSRRLRIAVVGAGLVGRKHAGLVARLQNLSGIADPSEEAADTAALYGTAHYRNIETLLDSETPDGAIIATPNRLHVAHAMSCIEQGIPVLIEKPIADRTEDAAGLVAEADRRGVPVLVGHHRRHNPLIAAAKHAIAAGRLGDIVAVNGQFWLFKPDDYFIPEWRRQSGAGPIFINLIHDIDLLRYLCGEITSVHAVDTAANREFDVEDTAAIILRFANGALGTFSVSDTVVAPWSWELTAAENPAYPAVATHCYAIGGTRGSLSVPDLRLWHQPDGRGWWEPLACDSLHHDRQDPLERQLQHFADVIRGQAEPLVTAGEGLASLRVIEAIKRSARNNAKQTLAAKMQH